jgi:hypothetical protein
MNLERPSLLLSLLVIPLSLGSLACSNRLLVGQDPDGGTPTGAAGTTSMTTNTGGAGTTGYNPNPGGAGTSGYNDSSGAGTTGTVTQQLIPLLISGEEAVYRLAAVIWKDLPDDDLNAQARLGSFKTTADLHGAVRQLLADGRARKGVGAFYRWWLDLDRLSTLTKDATLYPEFTPELAADMATETETFGVNVTLDPNGTYKTLMTAPYTYVTERLGKIYETAGAAGNMAFQRIELDTERRAGLLTQPALQALASSAKRPQPSHRGAEIFNRILCRPVPLPPANLPEPSPITPGTTTRSWLAQEVSSSGSCAACHALLDPPGLAFEAFDAVGRWRTVDNGAPVDVSNLRIVAAFSPLNTGPEVVSGPVQLASAIANSKEGTECIARQLLSYALGRPLTESNTDRISVSQATATFSASGYNLKELFYGVLTSNAFLAP